MEYGKKTFRNLFEQWVEDFEGKPHMYKLVSSSHVDEDGVMDCKGCCFGSSNRKSEHCCNYNPTPEARCPVEQGKNGIVVDLGVLDKNGCLPTQWDKYKYPVVEKHGTLWYVQAVLRYGVITAQGLTRQEAIDNWNRR